MRITLAQPSRWIDKVDARLTTMKTKSWLWLMPWNSSGTRGSMLDKEQRR
jgi:hypothetical protein